MVFSSITFLFFFLPIVISGFFILKGAGRKWLLLFASLFFYTWGEGIGIFVFLTSILLTYISGVLSTRFPYKKKQILIAGISLNLLFLIIGKYTGFLIHNLNTVFHFSIPDPQVTLPLGISFFTFQLVSYLIDVYRGTSPAEKNLGNLALYASFFPQLIAGPIVRLSEVKDNLSKPTTDINQVSHGLRRFILGLAKKVIIADQMAGIADTLFALPATELTPYIAWIGVIAYAIQIYMDFSGYSDMAIGIGKIFGFTFPENFNYPYIASSIQDFWRRWHMTLSQYLRDYLYIPLGGSRKGNTRTYLNTLIVFTICGLWHGAAWTFVIWGVYYGIILSFERTHIGKSMFKHMPLFFRHMYVLLIILFGWVLFRAEHFSHALLIIKNMGGFSSGSLGVFQLFTPYELTSVLFCTIACLPLVRIGKKYIPESKQEVFSYSATCIVLIATLLTVSAQHYSPFIYFRF